jgi:cell division protein FtsB
MKRSRNIFYIVFIVFQLAWFAFSFVVEYNKSNFDFLFTVRAKIPYMKYITGFGLLLILLDYVMIRLDIRRNSRRLEKVEDEKNAIKAQMYDMINKEREAQPPIPPVQEETSGTEKEEENES